jgi:type I restriction enzyme S subunit
MVPEKRSKIATGEVSQENNTCLKQTELGEIPEEWRIVTLQDVCDWIGVGIASAATHAYTDVGVPMLRNQNIKEGYIDSSDLLYVTPDFDKKNKTKRIRQGDVITIRTGYPGISAVVPPKFDQCQCFTTLISRPLFDILSPEFLCCWINSDKGKSFVLSGQAGGAQQNFNVGVLRKMPLPLPPLPEQKRIAEILSSVDEAIASTQAVIDQTRKVKQGLLQQLLTRGIGHTKFKESAIGKIPESWDISTAGAVCELITKGTTPRNGQLSREVGDVPYLRVQNLTFDGRLKFSVSPAFVSYEIHLGELKRSRIIPGDVLINIVGPPLGKVSVVTS